MEFKLHWMFGRLARMNVRTYTRMLRKSSQLKINVKSHLNFYWKTATLQRFQFDSSAKPKNLTMQLHQKFLDDANESSYCHSYFGYLLTIFYLLSANFAFNLMWYRCAKNSSNRNEPQEIWLQSFLILLTTLHFYIQLLTTFFWDFTDLSILWDSTGLSMCSSLSRLSDI